MTVSVNAHADNVVTRFFGWVARSWEAASEAQAISALDDALIKDIARDCGVEPDQLMALVKAGPHAADEMIEMMRQLNIDPTEVALRYQHQFRDMQVNCSHCGAKEQCRRDLETGEAPAHYASYCNNADHLAAMRATPELLAD